MKTLGRKPSAKKLSRFSQSVQYKNNIFQNFQPTPIASGVSMAKVLYEFFAHRQSTLPERELPWMQTDLEHLPDENPNVVWFGHSSYLISHQGYRILVDPVLSGYSGPFSFMVKAYKGTDAYRAEHMPMIDLLVITHDHYDHLDYHTMMTLHPKIKHIVVPLGVGDHLEHWGFPHDRITELDWWETYQPTPEVKITATPARHYSGRFLRGGATLWASFALELSQHKIFIGGDSGYDEQFKTIGEKFGGFDLALLECGQYHHYWPHVHMFPEETAQAAEDLKAKALLPVHWAKFSLSLHPWKEPVTRLLTAAEKRGVQVTTPQIGEPVVLDESRPLPQGDWWMKAP